MLKSPRRRVLWRLGVNRDNKHFTSHTLCLATPTMMHASGRNIVANVLVMSWAARMAGGMCRLTTVSLHLGPYGDYLAFLLLPRARDW